MKIPKLKYYYYAMKSADYDTFVRTRQLRVDQPAEINIQTGQVIESAPFLYLYSQPRVADTRFRQLTHWDHTVLVLRIPADCVPRSQLTATEDPAGMWLCRANVTIPTCGVDSFELAAEAFAVQATIIATSRDRRVTHA